MPKCLIFIFLGFLLTEGNAQKFQSKQLKEKYETHFQHLRETVHLHLNKDVFFVGEEVWWTAYVYETKNDKPLAQSTNLHCALYNAKGEQLLKEMFLVENGVTNGSFILDSNLESGIYYIRAGTAWMKNFDENSDYLKEIQIINPTSIEEDIFSPITYSLQLLPEGGHLLMECENSIGVKLTDSNGSGVSCNQGKVYDRFDKKVTDVKINEYGLGKFILPKSVNHPLTLKIQLTDGTLIEEKLSKPMEMGVIINVNSIIEDKFVISIKTNPLTLSKIRGKSFHLAIHRDGLMALSTFQIKETETDIKIDKSKILSGTNIVTLFDENLNPLSERLIFNYRNLNIGKLLIGKPKRKSKDSISVELNILSKHNSPTSLSISALPSETTAKKNSLSIVSNLLLKPYSQSPIENASQYFNNVNRTKEYQLDLVLLTQGWSSYDWGNIFKGPPSIRYPFEQGISIWGSLTSKTKKEDQLVISNGGISDMLFIKLEDSTNFRINNFSNFNGDTLLFALKSKRKKLRKPELDITFLNDFKFRSTFFEDIKAFGNYSVIKRNNLTIENNGRSLFVDNNTIALEEVIVTEERIEKKLTRASPLIKSFFKGIKIGDEELKSNPTLEHLINKNGFRVINSVLGAGVINTRPFAGPVRVYVNDFLERDIKNWVEKPLSHIDEIYFEKDGLSGDVNAPGGVIRIYLKEGQTRLAVSSFAIKLVENSFTKPKKFYRPNYFSFESPVFSNFGIVHWEPYLVTDKKGNTILSLPDNGLKRIKLFIEGINGEGSLFSQIHEVVLD